MKWPNDFLRAEEHEWLERCQTLAVVALIVMLGLFAGIPFSA